MSDAKTTRGENRILEMLKAVWINGGSQAKI